MAAAAARVVAQRPKHNPTRFTVREIFGSSTAKATPSYPPGLAGWLAQARNLDKSTGEKRRFAKWQVLPGRVPGWVFKTAPDDGIDGWLHPWLLAGLLAGFGG
jgi:hypothetical protein